MKGKGAEISEVNTNEGLAKDLQHIIDVSDVLWKEGMSDTGWSIICFKLKLMYSFKLNNSFLYYCVKNLLEPYRMLNREALWRYLKCLIRYCRRGKHIQ